MEMRTVFGEELEKLMLQNPNIMVLDADLARANGTYELRNKFPERAIDVGIAEQNMASVAAGLSSYGFVPFITSFTPFVTRRIADQVAISISYAKQNVKIVGTDPGISAENNGGTHMGMEDVGIMRTIPGIVIVEPVDEIQLRAAMPVIAAYDGPIYLRLFRKVAPIVFDPDYKFDLFKADILREGTDVTIVATGIMVVQALQAYEELKKVGISAEIINAHTIKPLDEATILASARKTGCIVTCENHNIIGGLRSAVAEAVAGRMAVPFHYIGIPDVFGTVGLMGELSQRFGLTAENVIQHAKEAISEKSK